MMMGFQFITFVVSLLFVALCRGDDTSCPGCSEFSCRKIQCTPQKEYCIMKAFECVEEPCPKLPDCISASKVCKGSFPYVDETGGITDCTGACPAGFACADGFCCAPATPVSPTWLIPDLDETDVDIPLDTDGNAPPSIFLDDLYGDNEIGLPENIPCVPCLIALCSTVTCPKHSQAVCKQDNCTCVVRFEDADGNIVGCAVDTEDPDAPISFHPKSSTTKLYPDPPFVLQDSITGSETVPLLVGQNSSKATNTLESKEKPNVDGSWKYAVAAVVGIVVLCLAGYATYKFLDIRRRHKGRESVSEQKVPLSKVPSENNNEAKVSKPLIDGQSVEKV